MTDVSLAPTAQSQLRTANDVADIPDVLDNTYARAALTEHKREGLELAVKARWIAMGITALYLFFVMPGWDVLYYIVLLGLLCLNGYFIRAVGRVGQSRLELLLIFFDLSLLTFGIIVPNPFASNDFPVAFMYRFDNFQYFFVILAVGTMAYSWRTVIAIGTWTTCLWMLGLGLAWWFSTPVAGLSEAVVQAFPDQLQLQQILDPNGFLFSLRVQEVMVFLLVAFTLGISIRRFDRLLLSNAGLERERANLSRYFSPNVVEQLSQNDEPLKQVNMHDVAILFVDIVGFTTLSAKMEPYAVITLLRSFTGGWSARCFARTGRWINISAMG